VNIQCHIRGPKQYSLEIKGKVARRFLIVLDKIIVYPGLKLLVKCRTLYVPEFRCDSGLHDIGIFLI
jgi:hypothetical protein